LDQKRRAIFLIWKKFTNFLKRTFKILKAKIYSGNSESLQQKQAREVEIDSLRRESAVIFEKISRRI